MSLPHDYKSLPQGMERLFVRHAEGLQDYLRGLYPLRTDIGAMVINVMNIMGAITIGDFSQEEAHTALVELDVLARQRPDMLADWDLLEAWGDDKGLKKRSLPGVPVGVEVLDSGETLLLTEADTLVPADKVFFPDGIGVGVLSAADDPSDRYVVLAIHETGTMAISAHMAEWLLGKLQEAIDTVRGTDG